MVVAYGIAVIVSDGPGSDTDFNAGGDRTELPCYFRCGVLHEVIICSVNFQTETREHRHIKIPWLISLWAF